MGLVTFCVRLLTGGVFHIIYFFSGRFLLIIFLGNFGGRVAIFMLGGEVRLIFFLNLTQCVRLLISKVEFIWSLGGHLGTVFICVVEELVHLGTSTALEVSMHLDNTSVKVRLEEINSPSLIFTFLTEKSLGSLSVALLGSAVTSCVW